MFCNFIFDDASSEKYNIACVMFGSTSGEEIVSAGGETDLVIEKAPRSGKFNIISQDYSKPLTHKFQIINKDGSSIDIEKERMLKKWLCKRGIYKRFQLDDIRFRNINFLANISNAQIIKVGDVCGMEFYISFDSSYAYSNIIKKSFNITTNNQQIKLYINNDDDDYIYPDVTITASENCDLTITNSSEVNNRLFKINNVKSGETITIKGSIPDISTTLSTHKIWTDFNKRWLRLTDGVITLTVSNKCNITFSYTEPRKVGI